MQTVAIVGLTAGSSSEHSSISGFNTSASQVLSSYPGTADITQLLTKPFFSDLGIKLYTCWVGLGHCWFVASEMCGGLFQQVKTHPWEGHKLDYWQDKMKSNSLLNHHW